MKEIIDASGGGGGGTGVLVVTMDENGVLDKTWQEIHDSALTMSIILVSGTADDLLVGHCPFIKTNFTHGDYEVIFYDFIQQSQISFCTDSVDGYPSGD